jgi:integrase
MGLYREENPVANVKLGRKKLVREKRKLTEEQTRYFLAALHHDLRLMCCVSLFCTLRVSETLGLQEKHLDCANELIRIEQRFYRGDLDAPKNEQSRRLVPMGYLVHDLKQLCLGDPERYVFQIETKPKWGTKRGERLNPKAICRDDRDLNQHFLRPIAKELGFYWKGFGFHALRREAITAIGSVAGIGQAMNAAGHTHADMSLL